jgi:hypothetical protein
LRGRIRGPGSDLPGLFDAHAQKAIAVAEELVGGGWHYSGARDIPDGREQIEAVFNEATEYILLRGPRPEDVDRLRSEYGYGPEGAIAMVERIAEREQQIADSLRNDEDLRRRVDDVVAGTTYAYDLMPEVLSTALKELGCTWDDFAKLGKVAMRAILIDTPILQVEGALRRGNLKDGFYTIKRNDIYDLAALGVAVVYCGIVGTDGSAVHRLKVGGVDSKYGCRVMSTPEDLVQALGGASRTTSG